MCDPFRIDHDSDQLSVCVRECSLEKHPQVIHLVFIDRHDEDTIGCQQAFRELEPLFHKAQPLAMPPGIVVIDVSVVVLPVARTGVIRRVDVDAVDLPFV